jgi:hypothetical protein
MENNNIFEDFRKILSNKGDRIRNLSLLTNI